MTAGDATAHITEVVQSDWTPDEFTCGLDDNSVLFVYATANPELYAEVERLVQWWPCEIVAAASYTVWKRPL